MSLHTIGIGHAPYEIIYGDTFRYAQLREMCGRCSLAMEMEVGDDGMAGPSWLGYYKLYSQRNTCHVRLNCTRIRHARIICALA